MLRLHPVTLDVIEHDRPPLAKANAAAKANASAAHLMYMVKQLKLQHAVRQGESGLLKQLQLRQQAAARGQLPASPCMLCQLCLQEHLTRYHNLGYAAEGGRDVGWPGSTTLTGTSIGLARHSLAE